MFFFGNLSLVNLISKSVHLYYYLKQVGVCLVYGRWLYQTKTTEPIPLKVCVNVAQDLDNIQTYMCFLLKYFTRFIDGGHQDNATTFCA